MNWKELAITSHYQTAVAVRQSLLDGNMEEMQTGIEELIDALLSCPVGTSDNSPAVHCRDTITAHFYSPAGTAEKKRIRIAGNHVSVVPMGLNIFLRFGSRR